MAVSISYNSTFEDASNRIDAVDFHENDNLLAAGSHDGSVYIYDTSSLTLSTSIGGISDFILSVSINESANHLAFGDDAGVIHVYDISDWSEITTISTGALQITALEYDESNGELYASKYLNTTNEGAVYDVSDYSKNRDISYSGSIRSFDIQNDGNRIAAGTTDSKIEVYDISSSTSERSITVGNGSQSVISLAFDEANNNILAGTDGSSVYIYDLSDGSEIASFSEPDQEVQGLAVDSNIDYAAAASSDGDTYIYDTTNNSYQEKLTDSGDALYAGAIDETNKYYATGNDFDNVLIYDSQEPPTNFDVSLGFIDVEVIEREDLYIEVDITENGQGGTETITVDSGGLGTKTRDVTLSSGSSTTESFSFSTSKGDAGSYTLNVSSENDSFTSDYEVVIYADPAFSVPSPIVENKQATFTNESTVNDTVDYTWYVDNSSVASGSGTSTSDITDIDYTFDSPGDYTVELEFVDSYGDTYTESKTVTVEENTSAEFSYTPSSPLVDEQISFTDESTSPYTINSYSWDFGDGSTSTNQNPSHTYTERGDYTTSLTVTDSENQTFTHSETITVEPIRPTVEVTGTSFIDYYSAVLEGSLTDLGEDSSVDVYFEYRKQGNTSWNTSAIQTLSSTGSFSQEVSGLDIETTYEFRAVGENVEGSYTSGTSTFTTDENTDPNIVTFDIVPDPIERDTGHDVTVEANDQVGIVSLTLEWVYEGTVQKTENLTYSSADSINETFSSFYTPTDFGVHELNLSIEDDKGLVANSSKNFTLEADSPSLTIDSPTEGTVFGYRESFSYDFSLQTGNAAINSADLKVFDSSDNVVQTESLGSLSKDSSATFSKTADQTENPGSYEWVIDADYETNNTFVSVYTGITVSEPVEVDVDTTGLATIKNNTKGFNFLNIGSDILEVGDTYNLELYFEYKAQGDSTWNTTSSKTYDVQNETVDSSFSREVYGLDDGVSYEYRVVGSGDFNTATGGISTSETVKRQSGSLTTFESSGSEIRKREIDLSGNVDSIGDYEYQNFEVFFKYREQGSSTWQETSRKTTRSEGEVNMTITDLSEETTYEYKIAGDFDGDIVEGSLYTATTPPPGFEVTIDSHDSLVKEGRTINIDYSVENTGSVSSTQDIDLAFGTEGNVVSTDSSLSLNAGSSTSGSFTYDTSGESEGSYDIFISSATDSESVSSEILVDALVEPLTSGILTKSNPSVDYRLDIDVSGTVEVIFDGEVVETLSGTYDDEQLSTQISLSNRDFTARVLEITYSGNSISRSRTSEIIYGFKEKDNDPEPI